MASEPNHDYGLLDFGSMVVDKERVAAFVAALEQRIEPGSVVVEIGTGPGFFAVLAARMGARKVYAIEPNPAVQVARQVVEANGVADRVELISKMSTEVELPEPADVVVSDLRGVVPLYERHIPSIVDARSRLLKPGGALIGERDRLLVAPVEAEEFFDLYFSAWFTNPRDVDLSAGRRFTNNTFLRSTLKAEELVCRPQAWAEIDYYSIDVTDFRRRVSFVATEARRSHGFLVWFEAELAPGVTLSNAPGEANKVYGQAFFPWLAPLDLAPGDTLDLDLAANLVGGDYVWRWESKLSSGDGVEKVRYRQSTFEGSLIDPMRLRKAADVHRPELDDDGAIALWVLGKMDGSATIGEIAAELQERHPERFPSAGEALAAVARRSEKYSR